jgi:putative methyltransferase (TIGR04325 family)
LDAKEFIKLIMPPLVIKLGKRLLPDGSKPNAPAWEYIPEGWAYARNHPEVKGWNVSDILETHKSKWERFLETTQSTGPLGVSHESQHATRLDIASHNTIMAFGYALALAARKRDSISILDWGGGIGHYYALANALLPDVNIDYHCADLPLLSAHGSQLFPNQHFYADDTCFERQYDFVFTSGALFYVEEWQTLLAQLAQSTHDLVFVTRLPIVFNAPSFVFLQRAYNFGYNTEYLGWCLNRKTLLDEATRLNLQLIREFVAGESWAVSNAPEECKSRGFLFRIRRNQDGIA